MNIFDPQISGSLSVSGSGEISGDLTVLGTLFATISGTAENAVSASHAEKYTLTSSFDEFTSSYATGAFTGSFGGDGAGLYNIPASGVTGLNLSQISEGSATASISQANGLLINTNTEITGNLKVNNINVGTSNLITISVTDAGGKYFIDNVRNPQLTLIKGFTYKLFFPNMASHPFRFSTTNDGTHNGGTTYSTGVTIGTSPDFIQIEVTDSTPATLYYYCTAHIGMGNSISVQTDILNLEADRNVVYIDPSRIATTGSNSLIGSQTISGSLSVTGSVDITGSITLNGQPIGTGKLDETIFNSYTSSNDSIISGLEGFTSSIDTTIKNKMNGDNVVSSSIQIAISGAMDFTTFSTSISQSVSGALSDSKNYTDQQIGSLDFATPLLGLEEFSASVKLHTSSINDYTSSNTTNINAIHTATSSLNTFSGSILNAIEVTGSNLTVKGNLLVKGTTTQVDSTTITVGDNIIQLNGSAATDAGIVVQDATGASIISGSLLWDTTTDYWKAGKLGSEEKIILYNEYNTFSTSIDSRASNIQSATVSLNSYTASNNNRVNAIESTTSSLNSYTSSNNGKISAIESATSSFELYNTNNNIRLSVIESTTSSLNTFTSSASTKLSSLESASSSIRTDFNSYTSSNNTRLGIIESTTASLNAYTSSNDSRLNIIESTTGSLNTFTSSANSRLNSLETASSSIRTDFNSYTSSANTKLNSIESTTASLNTFSSSTNTKLNTIESTTSSLNSYTASANTKFANIETATSSLNSFTSSIDTTIKNKLNADGIISGSAQVTISNTTGYSTFSSSLATTDAGQDNRLTSLEGKTGSYATTGSNIFIGNQTITGSLYISQDLIVAGSSSIQHISSSIVNIADNIITVNAQNPTVRFGGLAVVDSGSVPQVSGSLLFDSVNDQWIFVHQNQTTITSSVLLLGPETFDNLGGEAYLTQNRLPKGSGIEHLYDSNITDTGTKVSINSNTEVTGTLAVTQNITSPNITAIQVATGSLNAYTSSLQTAIELTGSNLTVKGNLVVKGTTTNVNTATLDVDNNLINLNGTNATFAGLRVKDNTAPNQISGSLLWDATNDYWIAGQLGSEQRIILATEFNNAVTRIGNVETSTGSLNTFTSSANSRLNSLESASGSIRSDFNTYTSSNNTTNNTQNSRLTSIESTTSSLLSNVTAIHTATSSLNSYTSSTNTKLGLIETSTGSLNTFTSSANGRLNAIESTTSSLNSYTSSNTTNINAIHTATSSLNSYTSSNTTNINAIHTATSSLNTFSSSANTRLGLIETATSSLNSFTNSFNSAFSLSGADVTVKGNFTVSGTTTTVNSTTVAIGDNIIQLNGSGATNAGIVVRDATSPTTTSGSLLWDTTNDKWIAGPLGAEDDIVLRTTSQTLTNKTISGASNTLSNIGNSSLTNSSITIAGTSTSLGGSISAATIGNAIGAFSGSAQVALTGTTGFGTYIDQALLTTSSPTHASLTITGRAQIGGTDSRGVLTVQTGSTQTYSANTDPSDAGRFFVMQNTSTTNVAGQYSNITLQINPGGSIGSGRVLGDIRLVRNALNGTSARFIFSAFRDDSTYKDYLSLDFAGATFAGTINGLTVSSGTISSGTWNGSSISTTYTDAKITSVSGTTNQVNVSANTGAVTFSLPQSIHTSATPTFGGLTLSGTGTGNAATLKINNSSASSFNHSIEAFAANTTAGQTSLIVVGVSGSTKNAGYLGYNWSSAGSNSNYVSLGHWGADNLLRVYGDGTVYMGTVTTGVWNGTAIGDSYISSSTNWNTAYNKRPSSLGFSSSTVTLTLGDSTTITASVPTFNQNTTGTAGSAPALTASGALTTQHGDGVVGYVYAISSATTGLFSAVDNSNSILTVNRHPGNYYSQFGFSSNGNLYYRSFSATAINTSQAWRTIIDSGNIGSQSVSYASSAGAVAWSNVSSKPAAWLGTDNLIESKAPSDTAFPSGFYQDSGGGSGNPVGTWFNFINVRHSNTGNGHGYQIGMSYYDSNLWYRSYQGGTSPTFAAWRKTKDFTNSSYSTTFSSVTSVTVTHNLGTKDVGVFLYDSSDNMFWPSTIVTTSTSVVTITFASSRSGRVVIFA